MSTQDIVLPLKTPETEWVRGRALPKMSLTRNHARLQTKFASALDAWSAGRGEVGTEWCFRVAPPGEARRPLVPDVAFVANERLRGRSIEEIQAPDFAPTVAVEILSSGDDPQDVASKVEVYVRAGTALVIVIDPRQRSMTLHSPTSSAAYTAGDTLRHEALPDFEPAIDAYFAAALDRA